MSRKNKGKSGSQVMRPRARLISLLGEELISDEPVAVVELVKNAYDADASSVLVKFECDNKGEAQTLSIVDDGVGMSLDTVLSAWLEPGTLMKKRGRQSPAGRIYQGAKGVGRFAAARLASSLLMETKQEGEEEGVSVLLDWGNFNDDSYLDEIVVDYQVGRIGILKHGTSLSLIGVQDRKQWTEDDYRALHNRLSRLISPFDNEFNSGFSVQLEVPGFADLTGVVEPHSLTNSPKYRMTGTLEEDGVFSGAIEVDGTVKKRLRSRRLGAKGEEVACGRLEVEIRAWDRDRPGLEPYTQEYGQNITEIRRILTEHCGVSMYRDGFRVHPYGEKGNDWLQLDARSRQAPTRCLANNQIVGAIRITQDDNPRLIDRTTREGLVHNEEYDSLSDWFVRVLAVLEEERYGLRPRGSTEPERQSALFEAFDIGDVLESVDRELGKQHPVAKLVKARSQDLQEGVKRLQEHYSRVLLAAGIGQLVDVVVHEIGAPLGKATREVDYIRKLILRSKNREALLEALGEDAEATLSEGFDRIDSWLDQIAGFRQRLAPKAAGRRNRATSFSVQDEIDDNLSLYRSLLTKQGIEPSVVAPRTPIKVRMSRSNLGQVIANLLDNSIYWLTKHHGAGNGGQLEIRLTKSKTGFRIQVSDDGPGVAEEDEQRIFDQEFSRKPNGMGLGLFICRQIIEPYGRLLFRGEGKLGGACFEALFEQGVGI